VVVHVYLVHMHILERLASPITDTCVAISEGTGLSLSQINFVAAVLINCPTVALTRSVPKGEARHVFGAVSTLALLALAYGRDVEQFVCAGALVYFFMRAFPKKCGYLTWGTIFSYQIYLHYERASEESWNAGDIDFTGSFMMLVLKLISISMDYQDGMTGKKSEHSFSKMPSVIEYAGYLGGLGSVMVGPHHYYDEYMQYANSKGEYRNLNTGRFPRAVGPALKALMSSMFCLSLYFKFSEIIPDRAAILSAQDPSIGVWEKCLIGLIANVLYRLKYYFAWHVEECGMIMSGFGFSGYSLHDNLTPVWTKAVSAAIIEVEFAPSAALAVTRWNRHTGTWLRNYVYDRVVFLKSGLVALLITQTICGVWHGLSPSFVLFFSHSAILIYCSRILYRIQTKYLPAESLPYTNFMHSLFTLFMLNYLAGGYNVVTMEACLQWWRSVAYIGHFLMALTFALGVIFPKPPKPAAKKGTDKKRRKTAAF
jgi:hypothetical protein